MKKSVCWLMWSWMLCLGIASDAFSQQTNFRIKYQVTYSITTNQYSVWVVPQYNVPNVNNSGANELGATAQVSLKVPATFVISNVIDVRGAWEKNPLKLGPTEQPGFLNQGLASDKAYYVIGKAPVETNYGAFTSGVPVELFRFSSNACVGMVEILKANDPFVGVSERVFALNTAPSFYSRSGQPVGGNVIPQEQFDGPIGFGASCLQANPDAYTVTPGIPTQQPVLTNDIFNGGTPLPSDVSVTVAVAPNQGTTVYTPDSSSFTYTAPPGFEGTDTYQYRICDASVPAVCSQTTVTVTSTCPIIGPPTVTSPISYCADDVAVPLSVPTDVGFQAVWYTTSTGGVGSLMAPTPSTDSVGSFVFYVSNRQIGSGCESQTRTPLTVTVRMCRQIFAYNDNNLTPINTPVVGRVLTNDDLSTGKIGLRTSPTLVMSPINGTVSISTTGIYTYTPMLNFTGVDRFRYQVCDSGTPAVCDTALVQIVVYGSPSTVNNNPPIALYDASTTRMGRPVSGSVVTNDREPDPQQTFTVTLISGPRFGGLTLQPTGLFTYTPNPLFVGEDTFTYRICDNGTPILCDEAVAEIEVKDQPIVTDHLPPVAADDYATTRNDTPVSGNLIGNDVDPEATPLTINTTPIFNVSHGSVVINPNGTFTYTPDEGFYGTESFVYEICDGGSPTKCAQATAYLKITADQVAVLPKVQLQGALFGVIFPNILMRDDLRRLGLLPVRSPYPDLGWAEITPTGQVNPAVFSVTGGNAIVDWVFVELRNATDAKVVVDSRSALLQRDGDIVDLDGVNPIRFSSTNPVGYYVAVRHRNHLGVMSKSPVELNSTPLAIDFREPSTPTFTLSTLSINQAQVVVDQGRALWCGNVVRDNRIIYQGTLNDVNGNYQVVIGASGNILGSTFFKLRAYTIGDVNLNGEAVFQGTGNDVEFIYQNVVSNHPGNILGQNFFVIREQLP